MLLLFKLLLAHILGDFIFQPESWVIDYRTKKLVSKKLYLHLFVHGLFVFCFILLNQWIAIGFLITAKSVFRFGDLRDSRNRKLTEYILIGTLISFGFAIVTGILVQSILASQY
ncbi:MAG: DUF3307 domain-containing protein [Bacteroidales bacterium]|nr:DUF3307 domain-containing protein [Bacteroidales bacterium]